MVRNGRRSVLTGLMAVALLVPGVGTAAAQSPATGSVAGVVTGEAGEPLRDVLVTLTEVATGVQRSAFTTRFGTYRFGLLAPGEYEIFIERIGYAPRQITQVPVRPGTELQARSLLTAVSGPLQAEVEPYAGTPLAGARAGVQWLGAGEVRALGAQRGAIELARLASVTDETLAVQGLAPHLSGMMLDGVPFRPVAEAGAPQSRFLATGFPLMGVQAGQLVTSPVDVEFDGVAGGFLSIQTRPGTAATAGEAVGFWGGSVLPAPTGIDRGSTTYNDLQGGVLLRGPLLSDSARFTLGLEARRQETLLGSAWPGTDAAAELAGTGTQLGLDLERYRRAGVGRFDAVSALGRLDWAASERQRVDAALHLSSLPAVTTLGAAGLLRDVEGADVVAGIGLRSTFESGNANDLRLTVTTSRREAAGAADVAPTFIGAGGLAFGGRAAPFSAQETTVRLTDALHVQSGNHALKVGAGVIFSSFRYEHRAGADGEYYFGSPGHLAAGQGVLVRREGPAAAADWSSPTLAVFAQDRWSSPSGVDLLVGVRVEREQLPSGEVRRDNEWQRLTAVANDVATGGGWRISPRGSLTWDVNREQQWVLHAAAGIFFDRLDPLALAEWQIEDGTGLVRRASGLIAWPPVTAQGGVTAPTLTLLGDDFQPARTGRADAGITRRLGASTAIGLSGSVRRTENLVRRADANLQAAPSLRDQHNRAVYGRLVQHGSVLSAVPGTGRRFDSYDEVATLQTDGWSDYWGVTVSAEHAVGERLGIVARYTFSETTDNWFDARNGGLAMAAPRGFDAAADWADGISDFDVPHRAVIGATLGGPAGLRISGLYRLQSGMPFTPGFRHGVDISADGHAGNDPAFVDPSIPGVSDLAARWSCLQESAGAFAGRNSCRAPMLHTVDVSAGLSLFRLGDAVTEFMLEAFDLLESEAAVPDAALYLVNPAAELAFSADGRRVTVPLVVNPSFGDAQARRHPGRRVRVGFSIKW